MAKYEILTMNSYYGGKIQHMYFEIKGRNAIPVTDEGGLTKRVLKQAKKHEQLIKENPELWTIKSKI